MSAGESTRNTAADDKSAAQHHARSSTTAVIVSGIVVAVAVIAAMKTAPIPYRFRHVTYDEYCLAELLIPLLLVLSGGLVSGWLADRRANVGWALLASDVYQAMMLIALTTVAMQKCPRPAGAIQSLLDILAFSSIMLSPARLKLLSLGKPRDRYSKIVASLILAVPILTFLTPIHVGSSGGYGHLSDLWWHAFMPVAVIIAADGALSLRARRGRQAVAARATQINSVRYTRTHGHFRRTAWLVIALWVGLSALWFAMRAGLPDHRDDDLFSVLAFVLVGAVVGMVLRLFFGRALRDELALTWAVFGLGVVGIMVAVQVRGGEPLRANSSAITLILLGVMIALGHCFALTIVLRLAARTVTGRLLALFDLPLRAVLVLWIAASAGAWVVPVPAAALALAAAGLLIGAALVAHGVRVRRSAFNYFTGFVQDINQFYAQWLFGVRRIGRCTVPASGPVIVAANHTASIDPNLIGATCPQRMIGYVIAREYANFPFIRWIIRGIECVPVRRGSGDAGAVRAALRHLEQGKVLGIFPEGAIPAPGQTFAPRTGVAMLALRSGATIIPVHISGTRWSRSIFRPFLRRHDARVRYGRPIDLSAYAERARDKETLHEVAELIMARIRELGERK